MYENPALPREASGFLFYTTRFFMSEDMGVAEVQSEVSATEGEPGQAGNPTPQVVTGVEGTPAQEPDKEVVGIRNDLIEKRRENSYLKRELSEVKAALAEIKGHIQPKEPELDDDAILTAGELKRALAKDKAEREQSDFRSQYARSLSEVQQKPDFDEKIAFLDELMAKDAEFAGLDEYLLSRPNGPKVAYKLATQLMAERKQQQTGQVSQKLDRNLSTPPPMTGGSASPILDEAQRIAGMDPRGEEFDKMVRKVEGYL
jgi:hypothetical protein